MRAATQSDGKSTSRKSGDNSEEVTPVPISNTVVKLLSADDTWWEAAWESRTLPVFVLQIILQYRGKIAVMLSFFLLATSLLSERMVLCLLKTRIMQQRNNALAFLVHRVKLSRKYAGIVL